MNKVAMYKEEIYKQARAPITQEEAIDTLKKLNLDPNTIPFSLEDFTDGMNVELEHGTVDEHTNVTNDDLLLTGKITLAHLNESKDYYKELKKMERKLDKVAMYKEEILKQAANIHPDHEKLIRYYNNISANATHPMHPWNDFKEEAREAGKILSKIKEDATDEDRNYKGNKAYKMKASLKLSAIPAIIGAGIAGPLGGRKKALLGGLIGGGLGYAATRDSVNQAAAIRGMAARGVLQPYLKEMEELHDRARNKAVPRTFREYGGKYYDPNENKTASEYLDELYKEANFASKAWKTYKNNLTGKKFNQGVDILENINGKQNKINNRMKELISELESVTNVDHPRFGGGIADVVNKNQAEMGKLKAMSKTLQSRADKIMDATERAGKASTNTRAITAGLGAGTLATGALGVAGAVANKKQKEVHSKTASEHLDELYKEAAMIVPVPQKSKSILRQLAPAIATGGAIGSTGGAIAGSGKGETKKEKTKNAVKGALVGGVAGSAAGAAGLTGYKVYKNEAKRHMGKAIGTTRKSGAEALREIREMQGKVKRKTASELLDEIYKEASK